MSRDNRSNRPDAVTHDCHQQEPHESCHSTFRPEEEGGWWLLPKDFKNKEDESDLSDKSKYTYHPSMHKRTEAEVESYKNLSGKSGVLSFEIGSDFIKVRFKHSLNPYTYSCRKIASSKIEQMKLLAVAGRGLGTFMNKNRDVYDGYDR